MKRLIGFSVILLSAMVMSAQAAPVKVNGNNAGNAAIQAKNNAAANSAVAIANNSGSTPTSVTPIVVVPPAPVVPVPVVVVEPAPVPSLVAPTIMTFEPIAMQSAIAPASVGQVPVPAAVWLFGSALTGLFGFSKRKQATS